MTRINLKLFAHLRSYLPGEVVDSTSVYECENDHSINYVLENLHIPLEHCHLVLLNGVFIPPEQRSSQLMLDGDTLAVWPPVAGG
ncbi:MAG: MoaD/ThiS family protein [Hyphomicrobiales bacterium]|nr:MoaD/ThiS family protein [Hyphomicrobiales bacterium]